jgi:hypothetical protein
MNENAKKWVKALRSGEFEQGQKHLRIGDNYCCLGVACELYRREVDGEWHPEQEWLAFITEGDSSSQVLPEPVREWLGLTHGDGFFDDENESLANANDNGSTFDEIADTIENEPDGLFE